MRVSKSIITSFIGLILALPVFAQQAGTSAVLWRDRGDVAALNVLDGSGGNSRAPGTDFKLIAESMSGTAAKFDVEDENGARWKVKLGPEAKAETAATRLVWAAGYFTDEDYYRPQIRVQGMKPLSRGKKYVSDGGLVREARLKRDDGEKPQDWSWYETRVAGTREFNGLRVMMALINNWDLKADNNSVYDKGAAGQHYRVSDLGASLGRTGCAFSRSKGVMQDYVQTSFVKEVRPDHADFVMHSRPFFLLYIFSHNYYSLRTRMESITRDIPIADARWLGNLLGQLSTNQIGDCFRAGGFTPAEVDGYTRVVMQRIEALKKL
jgi:hypothetical protein